MCYRQRLPQDPSAIQASMFSDARLVGRSSAIRSVPCAVEAGAILLLRGVQMDLLAIDVSAADVVPHVVIEADDEPKLCMWRNLKHLFWAAS